MIDELNRKIDEHGKRIDLAEAKNAELCKTLVEITQELEGYADALGRTEAALEEAIREKERAVEIAEANILASIQDGGKSCQWCREAIIKNAGKPDKTPAYLDGLRVGANRKAMGFPVDAYRVHCPYQTSEEGADFFRGVSDGLRSKG